MLWRRGRLGGALVWLMVRPGAAARPGPLPGPRLPGRAPGRVGQPLLYYWSSPITGPARLPRRRRIPCEWTPGRGSAKPIACDATAGSDLDAVAGSGTMTRRGDGTAQHRLR